MRLTEPDCWRRLASARHGVLGTVHTTRGVDAIPVVFAVADAAILIPIDTLKPKRGAELQRVANISADSRCVLLVEHYEDDWDALWWVRVHGRAAVAATATESVVRPLTDRYPQYRQPGSIAGVIVLDQLEITGWAAATANDPA